MNNKAEKRIRIQKIRKNGNTSLLRRIVCLALASISLLSLSACKNKENNVPVISTTSPIESPVQTPEATPTEIVIETPAPVEFNCEAVFSEIFSDEALAKLYPSIEDFDKERERIISNMARIEDFEFYELTAEEQEFIKGALQGNIDSSKEAELREVLTKILSNDPYVFDDVDNEVKIDNRVNDILVDLQQVNITASVSEYFDPIKEAIIVCNCGNIENVHSDEGRIIFDINVSTDVNKNYFEKTVVPDYESNNWKGNYNVFDSSKFLLDGSEGQKLYKKLIQVNIDFFNSDKEDIENNLKELVTECTNFLLVNDALNQPGGIGSLNSRMHYAVIYKYAYYLTFTLPTYINANVTCEVPDEYVEQMKLQSNSLKLLDINLIMEKILGKNSFIYPAAYEELEEAQIKYGNENFEVRRFTNE